MTAGYGVLYHRRLPDGMTTPHPDVELHVLPTSESSREALGRLFSGNGTIYLVVGFFTYNAYRDIEPEIVDFLDRNPENELHIVVGPGTDQFSPRIGRDLWSLDAADRVHLYARRHGLHPKLYLRDGPEPMAIHTSANITKVGFEYNVELGIELRAADREEPALEPFLEWMDELIEDSHALRRRDLLWPVQVLNALVNWTGKVRVLPARHIIRTAIPVAIVLGLAVRLCRQS